MHQGEASSSRSAGGAGRGSSLDSNMPLQLALTYLALTAFPGSLTVSREIHSATFIASILEIITYEILELGDAPITFAALNRKIDPLVKKEANLISRNNEKLRSRGQQVLPEREHAAGYDDWLDHFAQQFYNVDEGCIAIDVMEQQARDRINETDDEDPTDIYEAIERHSLLGVFIRNLLLRLRKLSFDETAQFSRQVAQWCGVEPKEEPAISHITSLNRRLAMDDSLAKRTNAMEAYQSACRSGDYSKALASLRRFYDYQPPDSGRTKGEANGQHQHALLNLANFHYTTGGLDVAKATVEEAIKISRAEGDRACLQQCMSLLIRIDIETSATAYGPLDAPRAASSAIPESKLPVAGTPMEDLWAIKAAIDMGEPAHVAMRRVHVALARHENTLNKHNNKDIKDSWASKHDFDVTVWHAAQAGLWDMIGSDNLTRLHEDLAEERVGSGTDGRLTIALSRAARASRQGRGNTALAYLLDPVIVEGLSMNEYHRWSRAVWSTLEAKTKLFGNSEAMALLDASRPAPDLSQRIGIGGTQREVGKETDYPARDGTVSGHDQVRDQLRKAKKLQAAETPAHLVLPEVLSAMHLATKLSLWSLYRHSIVQLAMVLLSMEGADQARKVKDLLLQNCDQILASDDEELIVTMYIALGELKIAAILDSEPPHSFSSARETLMLGLVRAHKLESNELLSRLSISLGLIAELEGHKEREVMPIMWNAKMRELGPGFAVGVEQVKQVVRMVRMVGCRVAEGWR